MVVAYQRNKWFQPNGLSPCSLAIGYHDDKNMRIWLKRSCHPSHSLLWSLKKNIAVIAIDLVVRFGKMMECTPNCVPLAVGFVRKGAICSSGPQGWGGHTYDFCCTEGRKGVNQFLTKIREIGANFVLTREKEGVQNPKTMAEDICTCPPAQLLI